jgi:hypothetical protein
VTMGLASRGWPLTGGDTVLSRSALLVRCRSKVPLRCKRPDAGPASYNCGTLGCLAGLSAAPMRAQGACRQCVTRNVKPTLHFQGRDGCSHLDKSNSTTNAAFDQELMAHAYASTRQNEDVDLQHALQCHTIKNVDCVLAVHASALCTCQNGDCYRSFRE